MNFTAIATQYSFNNSELNLLPEDSDTSLNMSLIPASKVIGLYIGSTGLEFPEDEGGVAPVRVYFDHDSLFPFHEVKISRIKGIYSSIIYFLEQ